MNKSKIRFFVHSDNLDYWDGDPLYFFITDKSRNAKCVNLDGSIVDSWIQNDLEQFLAERFIREVRIDELKQLLKNFS